MNLSTATMGRLLSLVGSAAKSLLTMLSTVGASRTRPAEQEFTLCSVPLPLAKLQTNILTTGPMGMGMSDVIFKQPRRVAPSASVNVKRRKRSLR